MVKVNKEQALSQWLFERQHPDLNQDDIDGELAMEECVDEASEIIALLSTNKDTTARFIVVSGDTKNTTAWTDAYIRILMDGNIPFTILGLAINRKDIDVWSDRAMQMYQYVITNYADELIVLNINGEITKRMHNEIKCAKDKGIPIKYIGGLI